MFIKIFQKPAKREEKSSDFSKFFREASSGEKKKVFLDVARRASKEQLDIIRSTRVVRP